MGKLLRVGSRKSPDAEQLLTPRKSGFFGKRHNNGVRSEDYHDSSSGNNNKAPSARRLVTSVFKSSSRSSSNKYEDYTEDDDDKSPVDGAPPIPVPLPITTTNTSNNNVALVHEEHHSTTGRGDEETVMSDLTGTVYHPTPGASLKDGQQDNSIAATPTPSTTDKSNSNNNNNGVTFAASTLQTDSFYSAYSPSLGAFQKNNNSTTTALPNNTEDLTNDEETNATTTVGGGSKSARDYCKGTVLERVLGAVDGACHRSMDMTLGKQWTGTNRNGSQHSQAQDSSYPQWGMAPSEDDDSTNTGMDTSTFFTKGDTTTCFTRDTATCFARENKKRMPEDTSVQPAQFDAALAAAAASVTSTNNKDDDEGEERPAPIPLMRQTSNDISESELHENFELVLGQIELPGYKDESSGSFHSNNNHYNNNHNDKKEEEEEPKKRKWASRILQRKESKDKNKTSEEEKKEDVFGSLSNKRSASPVLPVTPVQKNLAVAAALAAATPVKETPLKNTPATEPVTPSSTAAFKQEQREALFQSVLEKEHDRNAPDSPCRDVGVEIQSSRVLKQQQQEMAAVAKSPVSPGGGGGGRKSLSSLVKRLRFGKIRRAKSTSSVPPTKRVMSSFSHKGRANANAATSSSDASKKKKPRALRGQSVPPLGKSPTWSNTTPTKDSSALMAKSSGSPTAFGAEEEKKEIEPADGAAARRGSGERQPVLNSEHARSIPRRTNSRAPSPTVERKPSRPEMKGLSSDPIMPLKISSSFVAGDDATNRGGRDAAEAPKSNKTLGGGAAPAASKALEEAISLSRLRSAPVRLSSEEALEQRQKELKKEKGIHEQKAKKSTVSKAASKEETVRSVLDEDDGLSALESLRKKAPKLTWKAATDAQGRTYYYHRETRKTTWVKPAEFEAEVEAVKKYKEEMEAVKKEVSETQEVVEGYKNVEAIQNKLRKKTQRDFIPEVWQTKQEILEIVKTMPLPQGTNIEKLLIQYDGREEQLLANLRDLVESKPFDEPFQVPRTPSRKGGGSPTSAVGDHPTMIDSNPLNISHASSISVNSSANLNAVHAVDVQHRVRTAVSASTRISEKTYLTEKTEKIRNTSHTPNEGIAPIREGGAGAISTGSLSSSSDALPPRNDSIGLPPSGRVPSKIPAVPRSRDLKVEEFANDRIAKETFNGEGVVPNANGANNSSDNNTRSESPVARGVRPLDMRQGSPKVVAERIVAMSSLDDDDDDSYNGDFEDTLDDRATDTASEKIADSISALSEADVDYQAQKENFERARRRALDVAVEREDWDLAAALSEGMKQVKESLYGKPPQREWTQTELDRFISENDWDAVSKYIAHMRSSSVSNAGSHISIPRGRDPGTGRDPDGFTQPPRMPPVPGPTMSSGPPAYVSEATKRASTHTQSGRRKQQQRMRHVGATGSLASSEGSGKRAQTRFGARSQLQHSELNSISSWTNSSHSSSSESEEYTDNSYESEDEHGYISLRVRRNEFEC